MKPQLLLRCSHIGEIWQSNGKCDHTFKVYVAFIAAEHISVENTLDKDSWGRVHPAHVPSWELSTVLVGLTWLWLWAQMTLSI